MLEKQTRRVLKSAQRRGLNSICSPYPYPKWNLNLLHTKIAKKLKMSKGLFITVNYRSSQLTTAVLRNISEIAGCNQLEIAVIDNSEQDAEFERLQKFATDCKFVPLHLFQAPSNIGYFGAANFALNKLHDRIDSFAYIIVANNDIEIKDSFFFEKLNSEINEAAILAPNIISTVTGKHQNPHRLHPVSKWQKYQYMLLYSNYYIGWLLYHFRKIGKSLVGYRDISIPEQKMKIFAAHGSLIIFTKRYFQSGGTIEYEYYLYGEEDSVAAQCYKLKQIILFCPGLTVFHNEHHTLQSSGFKKRIYMMQKKAYHYIKNKYDFFY
jgi:GT2 family glycosyltransferase